MTDTLFGVNINFMSENLYSFTVQDSDHNSYPLSQHKGKVVLIVNVASKCGFTPQYAELESLYQSYKDKGLVILGFPCNQFGSQEPGSDSEIQSFCSLNYRVSFPVLAKIEVNGSNTVPIYKWLKSQAKGLLGSEMIKWNFTKFLISSNGEVIKRFAPQTNPKDLEPEIKKLLGL